MRGGLWEAREGNIVHITNTQSAFSEWTTPELTVGVIIKIIGDGKGGLWVVRRGSGWNNGGDVVHITNTQQLTTFPYKETSLLGRTEMQLVVRDDNEGLWIGTDQGLIHLSSDGTSNTPNPLPFFEGTIANDGNGCLWMWDPSTLELSHFANEGETVSFNQLGDLLTHLDNQQWEVNNAVDMSASFLNDGHGGVWIGTKGGGLAHLNANGEWRVFDTTSGLPNNFVYSLTSDGQGGIWLGTKGGLVHFTSNEAWEVFNTANSDLPDNSVSVVASDVHGEVWMISGGELVHRKANGEWQMSSHDENAWYEFLISDGKGGVWVKESYFKPDEYLIHISKDDEQLYSFDGASGGGINSFVSDGLGGIWVGGSDEDEYPSPGYLVHISNDHETTDLDVSSLSSTDVSNLTNDDNGGVWIETNEGGGNMTEYYGGFNHLTVGRKQGGNRAAIIVAGGGNQEDNSLWKATESIATYLYKMLLVRKFVNEEIYYLSPMPFADVTGDGGDDHVVDAPVPARQLVTEDIRLALEWAKKRGPLDQPLYLFFIDHGGPGQLQLAPLTYMEAADLDNWLDDYQTTTGNQVVLVIDACYSGSFLQPLQAPNRAIVTSAAANELAYFYDEEGFSRFFIKGLWQGRSFQEAFEYARSEQNKMVGKINQRSATTTTAPTSPAQISQTPQLDDDGTGSYDNTMDGKWLRQVQVNANVKTGDFTLAVKSLTTATTLIIGDTLNLRAGAGTVTEPATEVWAVIRPPRMNLIMDTGGIPRLAFPKILLSKTSEKSVWETSWNQAIYNGDYEVTFYAKDSQGNIASSDSITITVTGGVEPPSQTTVQVQLNQTQYRRGEHLVATLTEDLTWGYDLYAAVQMPDGTTFLSLKNTNLPVSVDLVAKTAEKWTGQRTQHSPLTLLDLDLPNTLPTGQYCLYSILSPEKANVFETLAKGLWVMETKCFEIF